MPGYILYRAVTFKKTMASTMKTKKNHIMALLRLTTTIALTLPLPDQSLKCVEVRRETQICPTNSWRVVQLPQPSGESSVNFILHLPEAPSSVQELTVVIPESPSILNVVLLCSSLHLLHHWPKEGRFNHWTVQEAMDCLQISLSSLHLAQVDLVGAVWEEEHLL